MNSIMLKFPSVFRISLRIIPRRSNASFSRGEGSIVYFDGRGIFRSSKDGFYAISALRDRKSVIESPLILKVVQNSNSFIEASQREGIRPWNWFDVSIASRLLTYSVSGTFPTEQSNSPMELDTLQREFHYVVSSLGEDLLDLLQGSILGLNLRALRKRAVHIQGESSKSKIISLLRPYSLVKRILCSKKHESMIIVTDSKRSANEIGEILSKSYPHVRWERDSSSIELELHRLTSDLQNAGYILCPSKISSMVDKVLKNKTPVAVDFTFLDPSHSMYPYLPQRKKMALRICIPGYPEFRIYLNEATLTEGNLLDLFQSPEVIKVAQSVEDRPSMIAGLRLLLSEDAFALKDNPLRGFFIINHGIQVHNHLHYGDFLEVRHSGLTRDYSLKESLKHFVLPEDFRRGGLAQILALYFYLSTSINRDAMELIRERSSIEIHFARDLHRAQREKAEFFNRYCFSQDMTSSDIFIKMNPNSPVNLADDVSASTSVASTHVSDYRMTIHIRDLRPLSVRSSLEAQISECFKELRVDIQSRLIMAPYGLLRLANQRCFTSSPPFLCSEDIEMARLKYRLQISPIGCPNNLSRKRESKKYIQHGELLPRWSAHAKVLKRRNLFNTLDLSQIQMSPKT